MAKSESAEKPRKDLDRELDRLELKIAELRIQYEQFFVDILPLPPDELQKDVARLIRQLLKAPFRNSAIRFRLRTLIQRYQTYQTYWERVNKQREDGTYFRDVFKAEMREKMEEEAVKQAKENNSANRGLQQLYNSYETAIKKTGNRSDNLDFRAFKKSLLGKAKELKQKHGVKKLQYKIVVKDGKVVVRASSK